MYDVRRLDDNRNMVGSISFAGALYPMLGYGLPLVRKVRNAMTESGISDKITKLSTARRLTEHDRRLVLNDAIVYNMASTLAKAMQEYGVPKIAAAFRAALVWQARER